MGGFGSGNFGARCASKTTVEECLRLEFSMFPSVIVSGRSYWFVCDYLVGDDLRIEAEAEDVGASQCLHLKLYKGDHRSKQTIQISWPERQRRWFCCPLFQDGQPCNRRSGTLYLPPGRAQFGCRGCYDLTYESRRIRQPPHAGPGGALSDRDDYRLSLLAKRLGVEGRIGDNEVAHLANHEAVIEFERRLAELFAAEDLTP